ncbi:TPA: hypothetical protein ACSJUE_002290 [Listeria monocytogenes]|nr:hypothetical protein [Listeria monocytogenes]
MYMSIVESEKEIEKAFDAFYGAYKSSLLAIERQWQNAFEASRKSGMSLKSLVRTAALMSSSTKKDLEGDINRFLYVYFRNKPEELHEEVIEICKIAVKNEIYKEVDRIFD